MGSDANLVATFNGHSDAAPREETRNVILWFATNNLNCHHTLRQEESKGIGMSCFNQWNLVYESGIPET